jgi:hypothetical protein
VGLHKGWASSARVPAIQRLREVSSEIAVKSENEGRQFVIAVLTAGAVKDQG